MVQISQVIEVANVTQSKEVITDDHEFRTLFYLCTLVLSGFGIIFCLVIIACKLRGGGDNNKKAN